MPFRTDLDFPGVRRNTGWSEQWILYFFEWIIGSVILILTPGMDACQILRREPMALHPRACCLTGRLKLKIVVPMEEWAQRIHFPPGAIASDSASFPKILAVSLKIYSRKAIVSSKTPFLRRNPKVFPRKSHWRTSREPSENQDDWIAESGLLQKMKYEVRERK